MLKLNILRTQLQKCLRNYKADADVSHICSPKKLYNTEQKEKILFLTRTYLEKLIIKNFLYYFHVLFNTW